MRVKGDQTRGGRQAGERVTAEIRADMELTEHGCILYEREQADSTFILRPLGPGVQGQENNPCPPSLPPSQSSRYQFSVSTEASTYGARRSRLWLVAGAVVGLLMAAAVFLGLVLHFANLRREWAEDRRTAAVPVPRADVTSSDIRAAFECKVKVTSYSWDERMADRGSTLYRHMAFHIEQELDKLFLGSPIQDIYNYSVVRSIGPDDSAVGVDFQIAVKEYHAITAPELAALMKGALRHRLRHQGSSRLTFDPQSVVIFSTSESDQDTTVQQSTAGTSGVTQRSTVSSASVGPTQRRRPTEGSSWPTLDVSTVSDVSHGDDATDVDVVTSSGPVDSTSNSREVHERPSASAEMPVATRVPSLSHETSTPAARSDIEKHVVRESEITTVGMDVLDAADADLTDSLTEKDKRFEKSGKLDGGKQGNNIELSESDLKINRTGSFSAPFNNKTDMSNTTPSGGGGLPGVPDFPTTTHDNDVEFPWPDPETESSGNMSSKSYEERKQPQSESIMDKIDKGEVQVHEMQGLGETNSSSQEQNTTSPGSDLVASFGSSGSGVTGLGLTGETPGRTPARPEVSTSTAGDHVVPTRVQSANDTDTGNFVFWEGETQVDVRTRNNDEDHVTQSGDRVVGATVSATVGLVGRHGNSSTHSGFLGTLGSIEATAANDAVKTAPDTTVPNMRMPANESMPDVLESSNESKTPTLDGEDGKDSFATVSDIDMTVKPNDTLTPTQSKTGLDAAPERSGSINTTNSTHEQKSEIQTLNSTELNEQGDVNLSEAVVTSVTTNNLKNVSHDHENTSVLSSSFSPYDDTMLTTHTPGQERSSPGVKPESNATLASQHHREKEARSDEYDFMGDTDAGENSGGVELNHTAVTVPGWTQRPSPDEHDALHADQSMGNASETEARPSDEVARSGSPMNASDPHPPGDSVTATRAKAHKLSTNDSSVGSTLGSTSLFSGSATTTTLSESDLTSPSLNMSTPEETEVFLVDRAQPTLAKNIYYPQKYPQYTGRDNQTNSHLKDFGSMNPREPNTSDGHPPDGHVSSSAKTENDSRTYDISIGENETSHGILESFTASPDRTPSDSSAGMEVGKAIQSTVDSDSSTEGTPARGKGQDRKPNIQVTQKYTFDTHERLGQTDTAIIPGENIESSTISVFPEKSPQRDNADISKEAEASGDDSLMTTAKNTASNWSTVKGINLTYSDGNSTETSNNSATEYSQNNLDDQQLYAESSSDTWTGGQIERRVRIPTEAHQSNLENKSISPDDITVEDRGNNTLIEMTSNITLPTSENDDNITSTSVEEAVSNSGDLRNEGMSLSGDSTSQRRHDVNFTLASYQANSSATADPAIYANQSDDLLDGKYSLDNSTLTDSPSLASLSEETADSYREKVLSRPPKEPTLLTSKSGGRYLRKEALSRKSTAILSPSLDIRPQEQGTLPRLPSPSPSGLLSLDLLPGLLDTPALGGDVGEDELGPDGLPQLPRERSANVPEDGRNGKPGRNRKLPALRTDAPWTVGGRKEKPLPTDGSFSFPESRKDLLPVVQPVGMGKHGFPVKMGGQPADGGSGEAVGSEQTQNPLRMMHEAWRKSADVAPGFVDDSVERSTGTEALSLDRTNSLASLDIPQDFMQRSDVENLMKSVLRGTQGAGQQEKASEISAGDSDLGDLSLTQHEMHEYRIGDGKLLGNPERKTSSSDAQQDETAPLMDFKKENPDGPGLGSDDADWAVARSGSISGLDSSQADGQHMGKYFPADGKERKGEGRSGAAADNIQYSQPQLASAAEGKEAVRTD